MPKGVYVRMKHQSAETRRKRGLKVSGENNGNWKGGRYSARGYIRVLCPIHPFSKADGYIYEHHLVMEEQLGRYLTPKEVVHHINNIHDDNRPENLKLFSTTANHTKHHHTLGTFDMLKKHL
ncbi:hypothetical protein LCGC14_0346590 [marine sediment metagenome]|uniref:HNH nuclease domain-containing protein n=1 Tax=marine sediment metagenome TaxID=412755 RepID=A0A0F9TVA4_9ZZZZ